MARVATGSRAAVERTDPPPAGGKETAVHIPEASLPEFADAVEYFAAGSNATGEFRCADCGYGAVVQHILPSCPMCSGTVWERRGTF
jgi:hypothetical protein